MTLFVVFLLVSSAASAQQCAQCTAASGCIREFDRTITKLKADRVRLVAAQRTVGAQPSQTVQGALSVGQEIDKLKDCLGKIR
jgi:hypothetical protein